MRSLTLISLCSIFLFSCTKESTDVKKGRYSFIAKYNTTLSTGEIVETPQQIAFLFIWKADGRDFEIKSDISSGYAYDRTSSTSIKYDIAKVNRLSILEEIEPGRYFIYIVTPIDFFPTGMYSYTYFDIQPNTTTALKKVFLTRANYVYEPW
ncbi:MAG: hypothetical protein V4556_08670 [Bacteroidota bacterium]